MKLHQKKIWTFLATLLMLITIFTGEITPVIAANQLSYKASYGGEQPTDLSKGTEIQNIVDNLPTMPSDMRYSDQFMLLAYYVGYREENALSVTSDDLVQQFSESTESIAQGLVYTTYGNNWQTILDAYKSRFENDYPAIESALNILKDKAYKYAQDNNLPTGESPKPTYESTKLAMSVKSVNDTQAIIDTKYGKNARLVVYDSVTGQQLYFSNLIGLGDAELTVKGLISGSEYEFRLIDESQINL